MKRAVAQPAVRSVARAVHSSRRAVTVTQRLAENSVAVYRADEDGIKKQPDKPLPLSKRIEQTMQRSIAYLLPKGFPQSVGSRYLPFAKYTFVGYVACSAGGVLAMQSMLYAVGLGAGSIPLAAALNWVIKDGLGQLGGVLFASAVNNRFDAEPKRWRMLSSIALDSAMFLELLTPLVPQYFLPIASVANIGKNVSFLAASASRATIHKSFAVHENLADVTAKAGSQTIAASMVGTGLGVLVSTQLGSDWNSIAMGCLAFSAIHLTCTYRSLMRVVLNTVSIQRFDAIMSHFSQHQTIPSPESIAATESLMPVIEHSRHPTLCVGEPIDKVFVSMDHLRATEELLAEEKYLLAVKHDAHRKLCNVYVLYREDATLDDMLRAVIHAYLARDAAFQQGMHAFHWMHKLTGRKLDQYSHELLESSYKQMCATQQQHGEKGQSLAEQLIATLSQDRRWIVEEMLLESRIARYSISDSSNSGSSSSNV